jgi:hypothetical protein
MFVILHSLLLYQCAQHSFAVMFLNRALLAEPVEALALTALQFIPLVLSGVSNDLALVKKASVSPFQY